MFCCLYVSSLKPAIAKVAIFTLHSQWILGTPDLMWKWMEVYTIYFECVTLTGLCKKAENRESCRKKLQLLRLSATNDRPCHVNYCFHRKITTFTVTILHWQLTHNKGRAYVTVPIKSCGFHSSLSLGVDLKVFGHHFGGDGVHVVFVLQELLHGLLTWLLPLVEVLKQRSCEFQSSPFGGII